MRLRGLLARLENMFMPRHRWGADIQSGVIRLVQIKRVRTGWRLASTLEMRDRSQAQTAIRSNLSGYRALLSNLHTWTTTSMPDAEVPDLELASEDSPSPAWSFLWHPADVEQIHSSHWGIPIADQSFATEMLLPHLLKTCPNGPWLACRLLEDQAQIWLMDEARVRHAIQLDGGWDDEHLLDAEWTRVFDEELTAHFPEWTSRPMGILESGDPARAQQFLERHRTSTFQVEWIAELEPIPDRFRWATAVALAPTPPLDIHPGRLLGEEEGRRKAARHIAIGFGLCLAMGLAALCLHLAAQRHLLAVERTLNERGVADPHAAVAAFLAQDAPTSVAMAKVPSAKRIWEVASSCLPPQARLIRWDGQRIDHRWSVAMEGVQPSLGGGWDLCMDSAANLGGFRIQSSRPRSSASSPPSPRREQNFVASNLEAR